MDLLFLGCWTLGFLAGVFLIWKRFVNRFRLYFLMLLNLFFLAGLFGLYPIIIGVSGK